MIKSKIRLKKNLKILIRNTDSKLTSEYIFEIKKLLKKINN